MFYLYVIFNELFRESLIKMLLKKQPEVLTAEDSFREWKSTQTLEY